MTKRFLQFVVCIFAALEICAPATQAATFALEIQPVRIHFDSQGQVTAAFMQGCDRDFAGFIYRSPTAGTLEVGVLIRRAHNRCLGLAGMSQRILPLVQAQDFGSIISMNPSQEARSITLAPMQNIHRTGAAPHETLHAVYTSLCGTPVGLLIQAQPDRLAIGLVESSRFRPGPCQRTTRIYSTSGLRLENLGEPGLVQHEKDPVPTYSLRRAPLQLQALSTHAQSTSYKVRYRRACNEAPIGIVQQDAAGQRTLSMLVAHFTTMECPRSGPQVFWSPWKEEVHVPSALSIRTIPAEQAEELRLVRPVSYKVSRATGERPSTLQIKSISSCHRDLGLVSLRGSGGIALGILQTSKAPSCNFPLKKVTYQLEMDLRPQMAIKPLQLVGS